MTQNDWLRNSGWDPEKETMILVHGYAGGEDALPMSVLRDGKTMHLCSMGHQQKNNNKICCHVSVQQIILLFCWHLQKKNIFIYPLTFCGRKTVYFCQKKKRFWGAVESH